MDHNLNTVRDGFQAVKRKQECLSNGSEYQSSETDAINTKKQRLNGDLHHGDLIHHTNGDLHHSNGETVQYFPEINGHSAVNGHRAVDMKDEIIDSQDNLSEPMAMECTEEMNGHSTDINSNGPTIHPKLCAHGHLNSCTTYNVPCRYPRMYCHPGGLINDFLQIYHGL